MGTASTIYRFLVELSDIDRGVYATLDLRVAQHASEDEERMVVRVLARALAHEEGLQFGRGLSNPEDAALFALGPTGQMQTWIDVGMPGADRLHRASKLCEQVLVFTHKTEVSLLKEWRKRKIHRAEAIQVFRLPADMVRILAQGLERRVSWFVTIHDELLTITTHHQILEGVVERDSLATLCSTVSGI